MAVEGRSALTRTYLAILLLLGACARPGPDPAASFRAAATPISSMVFFEQSRLEGGWVEAAGYPLRRGCAPGAVTFSGGGTSLDGPACYLPLAGRQALAAAGPGRLSAAGVAYWVLWVDADYRTAVLGTPAGSFAAVLNRGGPIPPDRLEAARRVLAFNGYDLARLAVR